MNLFLKKTSAYISQYALHTPEMTVRETIDFSARCRGLEAELVAVSLMIFFSLISFTHIRDNVLDCTLWDALSVEFLNFYNQRTDFGPVVMIIKHARVKEPQAFLTSLLNDVTYPTQNYAAPHSTQFYTQTSDGSKYKSDEVFMKQACVISLGDMKNLKVDTFCVIVATNSHIRGHTTNDPLIKYKLDVEVYDGDDTAKFVLWGNPLDELFLILQLLYLRNRNSLIVKCFRQLGLGDPQEYPLCLDDIMERKFAFRLMWQTSWGGQASVEQVVAINESPPIQSFTQADIDKFACLDDSVYGSDLLFDYLS
ncbi:replication protein A 70 kDa DNA-binding subunit B [Trifolium repens]|nr:replication protein A 70 kDa DNA-binding subunit B [Trifolium repens]